MFKNASLPHFPIPPINAKNINTPAYTAQPSPMKIGIDCRMYSSRFTGIGRYTYELTENLFKIDPKNEYFLFFNEPEYSRFIPPHKNIHKIKVNARHYSIKEQTTFLRKINKHKLDLMHFTHFNAPIFYKRPSIVTIHDLTLSFYPGKKMNNPIHRMAYHLAINKATKNAKKIIAVSKHTKKDLRELLKTPEEKIEVIYEGVNQTFKPVINKKTINALKHRLKISGPYILYTGVWRSHKNLPNLIKAFHILKNDYQYTGKLVITGKHDPLYANEIFHLTAELNLTDQIVFPGMIPESDLPALYSGASTYVFPSLYEGFGLSPLEAMQCGTPVAASNASCIPEICGEKNALYFNPQDPKDIAETINQILISPALQKALKEKGANKVKQYSWRKMASQTLKLYQEK